MRILLVEDEPKIAKYIAKGLTEHGFIVDTADNGQDGLHLSLQVEYELIILDMMLPIINGWELLTKARNQGIQTSILCLTARDTLEDRVKGLEFGADDYLIKPFAFSELLARVRALLRRSGSKSTETLKIDDLELNYLSRKAKRGDQIIPLTAKEFTLLSLFMRRVGEVLSRTIIAEQVWDINFDSDSNVVDVAIKRLRNKIDRPFKHKLLHTIRGLGYVLEKR